MDFFPAGGSSSRRLTLATLSVSDRGSLAPILAISPHDAPDHFLAACDDALELVRSFGNFHACKKHFGLPNALQATL